jgi:hypothetical protein
VDAARLGASLLNSPVDTSVPSSESAPSKLPIKVYISYSLSDLRLKQELEKHLSPSLRQNMLLWSDREIPSGIDWNEEINTRLENADIILLLISADYFASLSSSREMERAIARHDTGDAVAIPIILRSVDWQASPLASLQVLPYGGTPITEWLSRDRAWSEVALGIRNVVQDLQISRQ